MGAITSLEGLETNFWLRPFEGLENESERGGTWCYADDICNDQQASLISLGCARIYCVHMAQSIAQSRGVCAGARGVELSCQSADVVHDPCLKLEGFRCGKIHENTQRRQGFLPLVPWLARVLSAYKQALTAEVSK
eukprot:144505-Amphidinium_carterae.1